MLVLGIALVAALLVPLLTRGSYKRLIMTEIHWGWFVAAGLAIQLGLEYFTLPRRYWHSIGFGLLVGSYVLILAFVVRNLLLRGMGIVLVGIACNALVIGLNQGMPVKLPAEWVSKSWAQPTLKHHPQQHGEKLLILSDIIILRHPYDTVMSYGDFILIVGLCDLAYNASRDPKRRREKMRRALQARDAAGDRPPDPETAPRAAAKVTHAKSEPDPRVESTPGPNETSHATAGTRWRR